MTDIEAPMADVEAEDAVDAWLAGHAAELATEAAEEEAEREADCLAAWARMSPQGRAEAESMTRSGPATPREEEAPIMMADEELTARLKAAAAEVAAERGKPVTAWQIVARAVWRGAPYEQRERLLQLAQAMVAPPPAAPAREARPHAAMVREAQLHEHAGILRELAAELGGEADDLLVQAIGLGEGKLAEAERLLGEGARFTEMAEKANAVADELQAGGGEAVA